MKAWLASGSPNFDLACMSANVLMAARWQRRQACPGPPVGAGEHGRAAALIDNLLPTSCRGAFKRDPKHVRLAAALDPEIQAIYAANNEEAIRRSVFGSPTFFIDGDMFYGQDQLDLVERALEKPFAGTWPNDYGSRD